MLTENTRRKTKRVTVIFRDILNSELDWTGLSLLFYFSKKLAFTPMELQE